MSGDETGSTPQSPDGVPQTRYQFTMRILFLLPVAIALPFAVAYLADSPAWGLLAARFSDGSWTVFA